jgi:mono/diheme cytochrome c family protein
MKLVTGLVIGILVAIIGALLFTLSGAFNVAATAPDSSFREWLFDTTMRRSVTMRSSGISAPQFTDEQAKDGSKEYGEMCTGCHGAPGKEPRAIGKGLNPRPPDLAKSVPTWEDGNLFWIIKNGIKMTAMPAFGRTHDDQTIWNIVAFLKKLPGMTPEQYAAFQDQAGGAEQEHEHGEQHEHPHEH